MQPRAVAVVGAGWSGVSHRLGIIADRHDGAARWVVASPLESATQFGALRGLLDDFEWSDDHHAAADALEAGLGADDMLVIDDGHELDEASVRVIAALVERGRPVAVGHRPTRRSDMAALDDICARHGDLVPLGRLSEDDLAGVMAAGTGSAVDSDQLLDVHQRSAGIPGIALALVDDDGSGSPGLITDRVDGELRRAGETARSIAEVLAIASEAPDDVIRRAADVEETGLEAARVALGAAGLTAEDDLELIPAIRTAVRSLMSAAQRRQTHRGLATALTERGGEAIEAAEHLLAAGSTGPEAAEIFARAGDDLRFRRTDEALEWYDEAVAAGATNEQVAAGRAEAAAFGGRASGTEMIATEGSESGRARLLAVRAAESSRAGRLDRSLELYRKVEAHPQLSADATTALTATALVGLGRIEEAAAAAGPPSDPLDARADLVHYLGHAVVSHSSTPVASAPLFVEAAEALERVDLDMVLPESPHAVGALCLSLSGDLPAAEALLQRAVTTAPAGPAFDHRHRLLMAWVHLRSARYELPVAEVSAAAPDQLDPRDQLLHAAIRAGLARRSGDVPRLREAWADAEPVLLRGVGDLFHLEPLNELVLAAVRLRQLDRARPVMDAIGTAVAEVGDARAWTIPAAWFEVQLGVEQDDPEATNSATERLAAMEPATEAQRVAQDAARTWCRVLEQEIDADAVISTAEELARVHLPWEASRLAGQAAVRISDAAAARRLLERARTFHHDPEPSPGAVATDAGLTAREVDVGRYVLDGLTYREIGAQLYISPKTVEHHVARIRRKVQANSRAEMLAALRALLSSRGEDEG